MSQLSKSREALKQIKKEGVFITDLDVAFSLDWLLNDCEHECVDKKLLKEKEVEIFDMAKSLFEKAGTGEYMNNADTAVCAAYLAHKAVEKTNINPYDILDTMFNELVFDGSDENTIVALDHFDKEEILKAYNSEVKKTKETTKEEAEETKTINIPKGFLKKHIKFDEIYEYLDIGEVSGSNIPRGKEKLLGVSFQLEPSKDFYKKVFNLSEKEFQEQYDGTDDFFAFLSYEFNSGKVFFEVSDEAWREENPKVTKLAVEGEGKQEIIDYINKNYSKEIKEYKALYQEPEVEEEEMEI